MNIKKEDNKKNKNQTDTPPVAPIRRRAVRRSSDNFLWQFIVCFLCLIIFALVIYKNEIKSVAYNLTNQNENTSRWELALPFNAKRQNILLMGVDASENPDKPFLNTRSDSIYLISIAPQAKNINVISIPRDSKVYIHSRPNPDKINHAFAYGGVNGAIKTVEQTLGVRIHHYLVVSNQALIEFIDKIGGIDVYVEKDMYYVDNAANLRINIKKGVQHLDGKAAEGYMRFRKDGLGDIGRIRRQQWFLNALANKMKDPSVIIKIPDIIKSVSKNIQTDFSFYELAQYAALVKSTDLSRVKVATLPGEPSQRGLVSYWILDPKGVQDTVDRLIYGDKPKSLNRAIEAGILYVDSQEEKAKELQKELEANSIVVTLKKVKHLGHDHIAIHNFDIPNDTLINLKNTIYILKDKQSVYDIIGVNKAARDFTVVLAGS